jgi:sugar/nucleoside kinase (ribokinase family)
MMQHPIQGVVCAGNAVWDILVRPVDRFEWSTTTWVDDIQTHLGGNGANTSYSLGLLGTRVKLLAWVGGDGFGDAVLTRIASAGVDVSRVRRSSLPNATTVALVNSGGDRAFLHRPGISREAFPDPIAFTPELVEGCSHFHLGNPFALPNLRQHAAECLRRAQGAGLTTSVDTAWDARERWLQDLGPSLPFTGILFANEEEARRLSGKQDVRDAMAFLHDQGAQVVVCKLGAEGCAILDRDPYRQMPAYRVEVIDTTGAGDCHAAGFLAAQARGYSLEQAGEFANAVAALAIQHLGATTGVRTWEETIEWQREAEQLSISG